MNNNRNKAIIYLLYVNNELKKNPHNAIKFIETNRQYFKWIDDNTLNKIKKEHNIK